MKKKLTTRILSVLEVGGARDPNVLQRILRAERPEFEQAIGHLILKGMILFKGKTSGRTVGINGRRKQAGFTQLELLIGVVAIGLVIAAGFVVDARGYQRGATETALKWEQRERQQQQEYSAAIDKLRADRDAALAVLQAELAKAQDNYEFQRRRADNEKAKNARVERDLRDGRIVFRDPGAPASGAACSGQGPADPGPADAGNAAGEPKQGELSEELAAFLWGEASRADEVVEDLESRLTFAQDVITAYYRTAVDCREGR